MEIRTFDGDPSKLLNLVVFVVLLSALCSAPAWAQEKKRQEQPRRSEKTESVTVVVSPSSLELVPFDPEGGGEQGQTNLSEALGAIPGVAGVRRNLSAVEPVIRGLGWERVQTQVDGVPVYGACPARMDPPVSSLGSVAANDIQIVKGLPPLSLGPPGTGGSILISTDYDRGLHPGRQLESRFDAGYLGARSGWRAGAAIFGGTDDLDLRLGLDGHDAGDYSAPDGTRVPAHSKDAAAFLSLGYRPDERSRISLTLTGRDGGRTDYPALPMDSYDIKDLTGALHYRHERTGHRLESIELRAGFGSAEHLMSNLDKPNRKMMEAETPSDAASLSLGLKLRLGLSGGRTLLAGADFTSLDRNAVRTRRMMLGPMAGSTLRDHLWPDVEQQDLGLFIEARSLLGSRTHLRAGLRADFVSSDALAADDASLGGLTISQQWARFYGDSAGKPSRNEAAVSANLQLDWALSRRMTLLAGAGLTERVASVTERFFAFAPAPGGFQVGNPSLSRERKREILFGLAWSADHFEASASLFYDDFEDYIYPTTLAVMDVNGDGTPDRLRGFRNIPATLYGAEFDARLRPGRHWSIPVTLAWVRGNNDESGGPLPEIPALEATLALRRAIAGAREGWIQLGGRLVDRQERIDASFGEDSTPGYAVFHLRIKLPLTESLLLRAGLENLLDKQYHEHLTREALLPVGGLAAGDEIPQPGRSINVSLRYTF